jgi:signal transduction histidine kinase
MVVIGSKNTYPEVIAAAKSWADEFITRTDDTPTLLPDIIERYSRRWLGLSRHPMSEGLLDARTRSAIIRLTVSTLAHEINNPLMTVMGTTELLLDDADELPPENVESIRMIQESARRIESTLTDLAATGTPQVRETPAGLMIDPKGSTD